MKTQRKPLSAGKKILLIILTVALIAGATYLAYYLVHFTNYNHYRDFVGSYSVSEGSELSLGKKSLTGNKDYKLASENDNLRLYLNQKTADIAVEDKRTGVVTYGVPENMDDDPIANRVNKDYLRSQIIVTYFNASRNEGIYDSWSMSTDRDQVTYEAVDGGIRVTYKLGDFSKTGSVLPPYLTQEKYEELAANLEEKDAQQLGRYYSEKSDREGMRQLLNSAKTNKKTQQKILALFEQAGLTEEGMQEQMALAGEEIVIPLSMQVSVEYRLGEDYLEVSVPVSLMKEEGGASIYRIQLLRNFGAADGQQDGYMVVPNGDGSIINFHNGKTVAGNYNQFVYGIDPLAADYTVVENTNNTTLPLFGICSDKGTILGTIEDGASLASVTAGISGKINNYNHVYPTFVVRGSETLEMFGTTGNEANLPIVEPAPYDSNLVVRYTFLDKDHSGYTGIAAYYRDRLIREGKLKADGATEGSVKFYYDVISGVEMTEFFLGKQYMGLTAMTSFKQAQQISDALASAGITNQVMNLQGWFNGGYYHDAADRIRIPAKLGGKSGLEKLNDTLAANGGKLYADVALQKVTAESKHFNYQTESAKYYGSGYVAEFGQVNPVSLRQTSGLGYSETLYTLISPKYLIRYGEKFADRFAKLDVDGVSLRDLGSELHSDKKRTNQINREDSLDVVNATLDAVAASGKSILLSQPNDYALRVADDIMNLPLDDNDYVIVDEDIPLYEMILHGSVDYCGKAFNLSNAVNDRSQILNMIEYGAAPHFTFTWQNTSEMKYSGMGMNYATTYSVWADKAAAVYSEVNSVLGAVNGETMVNHEILAGGLRCTTYSNGIKIYVNYTAYEKTVDGIQIPAMGYAVG